MHNQQMPLTTAVAPPVIKSHFWNIHLTGVG